MRRCLKRHVVRAIISSRQDGREEGRQDGREEARDSGRDGRERERERERDLPSLRLVLAPRSSEEAALHALLRSLPPSDAVGQPALLLNLTQEASALRDRPFAFERHPVAGMVVTAFGLQWYFGPVLLWPLQLRPPLRGTQRETFFAAAAMAVILFVLAAAVILMVGMRGRLALT